MGEAAQYEEMQADLEAETAERLAAARAAIEKETTELEQAYANGPQNYWQPGNPFNLKDIVYDLSQKVEGKVIGLPTVEDFNGDPPPLPC